VILWGNGRPSVLKEGFSKFGADHDADAFARDLMRCWVMCVEMLRAMHWWAQLWGLKGCVGWWGVVFGDLGWSPVGRDWSWS
jgi:hypothetical protein